MNVAWTDRWQAKPYTLYFGVFSIHVGTKTIAPCYVDSSGDWYAVGGDECAIEPAQISEIIYPKAPND